MFNLNRQALLSALGTQVQKAVGEFSYFVAFFSQWVSYWHMARNQSSQQSIYPYTERTANATILWWAHPGG